MYRLLIVDDEQMIVDWLYRLFSGLTNLELDIYKANTGVQAIEWMNRTKIDIVLSDIHMPEMNGLNLLVNIRKCWPDCKVIFLTGYNQFDYVYTAIKYEGVSYLLKTEDDSEIIRAVENAINEIENSFKNTELISKAKQHISMALPLLQKEYLTALLDGDKSILPVTQQQLHELEIPLYSGQSFRLLLSRIDNLSKKLTQVEKARLIYSIKLTVEQYILPHISAVYILYEDLYPTWVLQYVNPEYTRERTCLVLGDALEKAQRICQESLNVCMSFALSDDSDSWEMVPEKYYDLKQLLNNRIGSDNGMIITGRESGSAIPSEKGSLNRSSGETHALLQRLGALDSYLERGQKQDFFELFSEIYGIFVNNFSMHSIPRLEVYFSLSLKLLSYIGRYGIAEKLAFKAGIHKLTSVDEFDSWAEAAEYLRQLAETIFDLQESEQESRAKDIITKVQQYICEHISEDISLVKLGDLVYFNPSYFSRLFKQVTGANITDYVHQARIAKAKELLAKKNLKIHEIAAEIGYESPAYFAKFFKKATNMTPQEFRDTLILL